MMCNINQRILLIFAVLCILFVIPTSFANDITNDTLSIDVEDSLTVDDNTIYVTDGDIEGDGSEQSPYNSISVAVEKYNSTENSKIFIKNGNYILSSPIELTKDVNIVGESKQGTILDANYVGSVFKITQKSKITLTNITFKNADKNAALWIDYGSEISVDNCIFDNNLKGGIYHRPTFSNVITLNVTNSIFKNNKNDADGGAIHIHSPSTVNVIDTVFENNVLPTGEKDVSDGGAIYVGNNLEKLYIDSCIFRNNVAVRGSAISQYCGGDIYIYNSLFENNTSPGNNYYKEKIKSSVISDRQSNSKELILCLDNNILRNNSLTDDIEVEGNVKIIYPNKNTKITADNVDKIVGDDYNYVICLTDDNNAPISGKNIIVNFTNTIDNEVTVVSNITNSQGKATIVLSDFKPGKYKVIASFEGDKDHDEISTNSIVDIRTESDYNLFIDPNYIYYNEGDSYEVVIKILDEYLIPTKKANGEKFDVYWQNYYNNHTMVLDLNSIWVEDDTFTFDINRCHLITRDEPYIIEFKSKSGNLGSISITVDLSKDLTNIDKTLNAIYVSAERGDDNNGTGSKDKPLKTVHKGIATNDYLGGGKTVYVEEGTYEISTYTIVGNVTIVGQKSKTIFKQVAGKLGMFEIENANNVTFVNITFINGFATPEPEALIHVCEDSVLYVDGCEFYNNTAIDGSAIAVSTGASAYIDNSYFHDNHAYLNRIGGAIYVDRGYLYVANSLFENNVAGEGGAIFLGFPSEADIINSTFIGNNATGTESVAGAGGAIFTRSSNFNVYNSTFVENFAPEGGAIFIDYGDVEIYSSYFENNRVKGSDEIGSAVQGSYASYCNLTMHYSVLISSDERNDHYYMVYIPNQDENHTADTYYNYWKTNSQTSNAGTANRVIIEVTPSNEFIYTGDVVEFDVKFVNYNVDNGTSDLDGFVHDYALEVYPKLGEVDQENIVIKNNEAKFIYTATTTGEEYIAFVNIFNHKTYKFTVGDGSDKVQINSTIKVVKDKVSTITVDLDADISENLTIRVNDDEYSVPVNNKQAILKINTTPGEYEIRAIFSGNDEYKGFVNTKSFIIDKYASFVTVSNVTIYYNGKFEAKLTNADGKPIAGEQLIITVDKEYALTTNDEGIATLNLNLASVGNYTATTKFLGTSMYEPSTAEALIIVEFINIKVVPQEDVVITPLNGEFRATVTDNGGNPIKNTEVLFKVEGLNATVKTNDKGIAVFNLTDNGLLAGEHQITATVKSTKVYGFGEGKTTVTVVKEKAYMTVSNVTVFANKGEFKTTLKDDNDAPIEGETIIFLIGDDTYNITTDKNGVAILPLNLTAGKYDVKVKLQENNVYAAETVTANIDVKEDVITISAPDVTVFYKGKFSVTLIDSDGKGLENETVIIKINNQSYGAKTNVVGIASINIDLGLGTYQADISFLGNDVYKPANATSAITVLSSIDSKDMNRSYNTQYDFKANLVDINGNPLSKQQVTFIVNGKEYYSITDENGTVMLSEKFDIGSYAITIINSVTGEKTANYANIVKRLSGNKNITMYFGAGKTFKVRAFDDDGNPVGAGEVVKIVINKKTYSRTTNENGYASFKITLKSGTYTITATYKGFKVSNKVVVKPVLTAKSISKKKAKTIKFSAKLVSTKGKALKNKKITFKFKGKNYKVKTNKKGVATLSLKNLKVGKYTIKVTYGKSTISRTIKIKK